MYRYPSQEVLDSISDDEIQAKKKAFYLDWCEAVDAIITDRRYDAMHQAIRERGYD